MDYCFFSKPIEAHAASWHSPAAAKICWQTSRLLGVACSAWHAAERHSSSLFQTSFEDLWNIRRRISSRSNSNGMLRPPAMLVRSVV